MTTSRFIDDNLAFIKEDEINRIIKLRGEIISRLYAAANSATERLLAYAQNCNDAKDARDVAEALLAFKFLLADENQLQIK